MVRRELLGRVAEIGVKTTSAIYIALGCFTTLPKLPVSKPQRYQHICKEGVLLNVAAETNGYPQPQSENGAILLDSALLRQFKVLGLSGED